MAIEHTAVRVSSPSYQAYQILHIAFAVAPILAGADKFFHLLGNWNAYLAPVVPATLGVSPYQFMLGVGVVEIVAGLLVAIALARISVDYSGRNFGL